MAPLHFEGTAGILVTLAIGFCFGFVLERAGFGNARNLAAQFYLYDMRVLKVMFTAIVTAMLLVFASSALGWLDFSHVWVPPTYLWPGVVGGFILGIGFIIGGYCPGTSLVSMATLKVDGALFALGVFGGLLVFAGTAPVVWEFWNHAGFYGRLTLFDLLGADAGVVVVGVFAMAVGAFGFAEWMEYVFRREPNPAPVSSRVRVFRRAAVAVGLFIAVATLAIGQPTAQQLIAWNEPELEKRLASREVFIDPAELLGLMHNNQIALLLVDVRDEADFNRFHLLDATRVGEEQLESPWPGTIPAATVVVAMSNDERAAVEAWKRLVIHRNVNAYVLAGGINRWLDVYRDQMANIPGPEVGTQGNDTLRHRFSNALGDRVTVARPNHEVIRQRSFTPKVKVLGPVREEGGGCG